MANVITPTTAIAYLLTDGSVVDKTGFDSVHPGSTLNQVIIYVEDGDENNVMSINYNPEIRKKWASHWFPLFYRGLVEHTLENENEPRTFAQYQSYIPTILSCMNINSTTPMTFTSTVRQQAGNNLIGSYATVASLPTSTEDYDDLQDMEENDVVAYVYEAGVNGFYMVEFDVTYSWVLQTSGITNFVTAKPYNVITGTLLGGFNNPDEITELTDEQYRLIWQELSQLSASIVSNDDDISDILDGTTPVGKAIADQYGNVIDLTYQLISNLVAAFQATPDDTHYPSEKLVKDTIDAILDGTTPFTKIKSDIFTYLEDDDTEHDSEWDEENKTIKTNLGDGVVLQHGQELQDHIKNNEGAIFYDMQLGMLDPTNPTTGNNLNVVLSNMTYLTINPRLVLGVITQEIAVATNGKLTTYGAVNGDTRHNANVPKYIISGGAVVTGDWAEGQLLYAYTVNGSMIAVDYATVTADLNIALPKPLPRILVGVVARVGAAGRIKIRPEFPIYARNIGDFENGTYATGEIFKYNGTTELFEKFDLDAALLAITTQLSTVYKYKGSVATYADLAAKEGTAEIGDVWNVIADESTDGAVGVNYAWTGSAWDNIGGIEALATATNDGLMSQEDFSKLLALPTYAELVALLLLKVDKTQTIAGVDLQDNITASELLIALSLENVDNTPDTEKPISDDTQVALDLKRDNDPSALVGVVIDGADIIDVYDVSTSTLKKTTWTELLASIADGTTTFINSADYGQYGLGAWKTAVVSMHTATLNSGADVYIDIKTMDAGNIIRVTLPAIVSTNDLRLSTDGVGGTYMDILVNDANIPGNSLSAKQIELLFDGTDLLYYGSNAKPVEQSYYKAIDSTFGTIAPVDFASPLMRTIYGLSPNQLLLNGDLSDSATNWNDVGGIVYNGSTALATATASGSMGIYSSSPLVVGEEYYLQARVKPSVSANIILGSAQADYGVTVDEWNIISILYTATDALCRCYLIADASGDTFEIDYVMAIPLANTSYSARTLSQLNAQFPTYLSYGYTDLVNPEFSFTGLQRFDKGSASLDSQLSETTGEISANVGRYVSDYIAVKTNTNYRFNNRRVRWVLYDKDKNYISGELDVAEGATMATADASYLKFSSDMDDIDTAQLEEGSTETDYRAYASPSDNFVVTGTAREVGSVRDTFDWNIDHYELTQRIGLDYNDEVQSATTWTIRDVLTNTHNFCKNLQTELGYKVPATTSILSSIALKIGDITFTAVTSSVGLGTDDENTFFIVATSASASKELRIRVNKTTYANTGDFETYLQANDVTFYYELDDYVVTTVDQDGSTYQEEVTTIEQVGDFGTDYDMTFALNRDAQDIIDRANIQKIQKGQDAHEVILDALNIGQEEDLRFSATFVRQGATFKPDFDTTEIVLLFPQNVTTEVGYVNAQMPHGWAEGTDIQPHVHIIQELDLQVVYKMDYRWYNLNDAVPAGWTTYTMDQYVFTYVSGSLHQKVTGSAPISGSGFTASSVLQIKLYRDDNVYTGDSKMIEFDIHYKKSRLGKDV